MGRSKFYREYDKETGELIKLECHKCHEIKTVDCFSKDKSKKDGVRTKCRQCDNERSRQYRENNKEKIYERQRQWRKNHKEEIREYDRQYNKNHKEKIYERNRRYYENNKEKMDNYKRQYYKNNKEKIDNYKRWYCENNKEKMHEKYHQRWENDKEKLYKKYRQRYENKAQQEITKIYENVTKQRYPYNGIQYGIIYGVVCKVTNRWYIGQTTSSFNIRYGGNFLKINLMIYQKIIQTYNYYLKTLKNTVKKILKYLK